MAEKTFEAFVAGERERLTKKREELFSQQQKLQEELDSVNAEMRAIDAYEAVKSGKPVPTTAAQSRARRATGTRRSGIRDEILSLISSNPDGYTAAEVREKQGVPSDDRSGSQSVANALAALKKKGTITQRDDGKYVAA